MTDKKSFLHNVYDAMVAARTRQVERELSAYHIASHRDAKGGERR